MNTGAQTSQSDQQEVLHAITAHAHGFSPIQHSTDGLLAARHIFKTIAFLDLPHKSDQVIPILTRQFRRKAVQFTTPRRADLLWSQIVARLNHLIQ